MFKAAIFDMDGVLVDSEHRWKRSGPDLFGLVPGWSSEDDLNITGLGLHEIVRYIEERHGVRISAEQYHDRVQGFAVRLYHKEVQLIPGSVELAQRLHLAGMKLAIASSSPEEWIDIVRERFKLKELFPVAVSGRSFQGKGKPAPDIYLHTAHLLNLSPAVCVVFEDSAHGVRAAKTAGMRCVGVSNEFNIGQTLPEADLLVHEFPEVTLQVLARLAKSIKGGTSLTQSMDHYVCSGSCNGVSENSGACQAQDCERYGEPLEKCACGNAEGHRE